MSAPAASDPVDHQFHADFFGIPCGSGPVSFPTVASTRDWVTFCVSNWVEPSVWHGCTLSQLHAILQVGVWRPGLWQAPSRSSPLGVWVADSPSMAIDRASMSRGYGYCSGGVPDGWDCPVAIGYDLPRDEMTRHGVLTNGTELFCIGAK